MYSCVHDNMPAPRHVLLIVVCISRYSIKASVADGCECARLFARIPTQSEKEDKLMMPQKKTGPENLPLKAVIALMAAAASAATVAVLSRPAKDPQHRLSLSSSLSLEA